MVDVDFIPASRHSHACEIFGGMPAARVTFQFQTVMFQTLAIESVRVNGGGH